MAYTCTFVRPSLFVRFLFRRMLSFFLTLFVYHSVCIGQRPLRSNRQMLMEELAPLGLTFRQTHVVGRRVPWHLYVLHLIGCRVMNAVHPVTSFVSWLTNVAFVTVLAVYTNTQLQQSQD